MEVEGASWVAFLSLGTKVEEKQGKGSKGGVLDGGNTFIMEWVEVKGV